MNRKSFLKTGLITAILGLFSYKAKAEDYSQIIKEKFNAKKVVKNKSGTCYIIYLVPQEIKDMKKLMFDLQDFKYSIRSDSNFLILDANKNEDVIPFFWLESC